MTLFWIVLGLSIIIAAVNKVVRMRKAEAENLERISRNKAASPQAPSGTKKGKTALPPEVQEAIDAGKNLMAVKLYREYTGCSLAEAKAVIDAHSK